MMETEPDVKAIFGEALDRPTAAERAAYLDEACRGDAALRGRVEDLPLAHGDAGGFLERPAVPTTIPAPGTRTEGAGTAVGPDEPLQEIGGGLRDAGAWRSLTGHRRPDAVREQRTGGLTAALPMTDVSRILLDIERGDAVAAERLLPLVYDELRKLAAQRLAREKPGQTLQATALVHEAYLRLVGGDQPRDWDGRRHFFAAAAEAMRRILIDRARHKHSRKAGGEYHRLELDAIEPAREEGDGDRLLALDEALQRLEAEDPRKAELVKLRFFAGLSAEQAAAALGVSLSTAEKDWAYARSWLRVAIDGKFGRRP
jgi:RNA polymerase sigma factor (TIGR02999 family)